MVVFEPGSRPAAGRPEGLALTPAVVVPGNGIMVVAPPVGRGPGCRSLAAGWRREGHGEPGFGPRSHEVVAARLSGAGAYLRHARDGGDMKPCGHDHGNSLMVLDHTLGWVMPILRAARWPWPDLMRRGETADLTVAQPVVDERQQVAGGGDAADVATPPATDACFDRSDLRVTHRPRDCFHRRPTQQPRALLGDPAALDVLSDSRWRGVSPAHEHNRSALANRVTSPISATNTAANTGRPHATPAPPRNQDGL